MADRERRAKPNYFQSLYRETLGELRKVSWPTWPEARRLTWLVLMVMLIMGLLLGIVDLLSREGLNILIGVA